MEGCYFGGRTLKIQIGIINIKYMGKTTKYTERRFLGKTEGFKDKAEERLEQKHLNAYLKGHKQFKHGFTKEKNILGIGQPIIHKVKQEVVIDQEKYNLLKNKNK